MERKQIETIKIGTEPMHRKLSLEEIEIAVSLLQRETNGMTPEIVRSKSAGMLMYSIKWIREINNPAYLSRREALVMQTLAENLSGKQLPDFLKICDKYKNMLGIKTIMAEVKTLSGEKGESKRSKKRIEKKIQTLQLSKDAMDFDEMCRISNANAVAINLMAQVFVKRYCATHFKMSAKTPALDTNIIVLLEKAKLEPIKIKEVKKAIKILGLEKIIRGKDFYLIKKLFGVNN